MQIDKVLVFETDAEANVGIERMRFAGYRCIAMSAASATSRRDTRLKELEIVLGFEHTERTYANEVTTPIQVPDAPAKRAEAPQTLRDLNVNHAERIGVNDVDTNLFSPYAA